MLESRHRSGDRVVLRHFAASGEYKSESKDAKEKCEVDLNAAPRLCVHLSLRNNPTAMPRPAIFFDRDNTLIACNDYLGDPSQVRLISGAADAIDRARALGYAIVVFSNQSGVARGMFSEDDVHARQRANGRATS